MPHDHRQPATRLILRFLVVAGLAVDAYVHFKLAAQYSGNTGSGISQGTLFRIEAGAAALMAVATLLSGRRPVQVVVFLVAASALGAVLLYRYVDVGPLGPLPDMYDPGWYPEKTLSAIAEAIATIGAAALVVLPHRTVRVTADAM
jgi:hypothetical protein